MRRAQSFFQSSNRFRSTWQGALHHLKHKSQKSSRASQPAQPCAKALSVQICFVAIEHQVGFGRQPEAVRDVHRWYHFWPPRADSRVATIVTIQSAVWRKIHGAWINASTRTVTGTAKRVSLHRLVILRTAGGRLLVVSWSFTFRAIPVPGLPTDSSASVAGATYPKSARVSPWSSAKWAVSRRLHDVWNIKLQDVRCPLKLVTSETTKATQNWTISFHEFSSLL